jgi:hypothetical protein
MIREECRMTENQLSFLSLDYAAKKKRRKREAFLC